MQKITDQYGDKITLTKILEEVAKIKELAGFCGSDRLYLTQVSGSYGVEWVLVQYFYDDITCHHYLFGTSRTEIAAHIKYNRKIHLGQDPLCSTQKLESESQSTQDSAPSQP